MFGAPALGAAMALVIIIVRIAARPKAEQSLVRRADAQTPASEPASVTHRDSVRPAPRPGGPPLTPKIVQGRTALGDGMFAERSDSVITVYFDTPATRTRLPDKFERIVRQTLPIIYGPPADSILGTVLQRTLTNSGDLLTELPDRGVQLPLADGWVLGIWPATRPGRDGALVVTYRTMVSRPGR